MKPLRVQFTKPYKFDPAEYDGTERLKKITGTVRFTHLDDKGNKKKVSLSIESPPFAKPQYSQTQYDVLEALSCLVKQKAPKNFQEIELIPPGHFHLETICSVCNEPFILAGSQLCKCGAVVCPNCKCADCKKKKRKKKK